MPHCWEIVLLSSDPVSQVAVREVGEERESGGGGLTGGEWQDTRGSGRERLSGECWWHIFYRGKRERCLAPGFIPKHSPLLPHCFPLLSPLAGEGFVGEDTRLDWFSRPPPAWDKATLFWAGVSFLQCVSNTSLYRKSENVAKLFINHPEVCSSTIHHAP